MRKFKDITGKRFGELIALEPTDERSGNGSIIWKCQCKCGNTCHVAYFRLINKNTTSCGCLRHENLTGKRFGRLEVIRWYETKRRQSYWECKCDCGNKTVVVAGNLRTGHVKSCGCLMTEVNSEKMKSYMKKQEVLANMKDTLGLVDGTMITMLNDNPTAACKSGVRGVFWISSKEKWRAEITFKRKNYYLGLYSKKEDAIKARKEAEDELWKPFIEEHSNNAKPELEQCKKPQEGNS